MQQFVSVGYQSMAEVPASGLILVCTSQVVRYIRLKIQKFIRQGISSPIPPGKLRADVKTFTEICENPGL